MLTSRALLTANTLACMALGTAACGGQSADTGAAAVKAAAVTAAPVASALERTHCSMVAAIPTWLPRAAATHIITCRSPGSAPPASGTKPTDQSDKSVTVQPGVLTETIYALKGAVNTSTVMQDPRNGHTGTDIDIIKYVGSTRISPSLVEGQGAPAYLRETRTTLSNGATAQITQTANGYGPVRIEWVFRGDSYLLMSSHTRTHDHGTSGVPTSDLVKVAGSITN